MKEEGFACDLEPEFALIWVSHQALLAATLLLLMSRGQPGTRQRVGELGLNPLTFLVSLPGDASLAVAPTLFFFFSSLTISALRAKTPFFLAQFPVEVAVKLHPSRPCCFWLGHSLCWSLLTSHAPLPATRGRQKANTPLGTGCGLLPGFSEPIFDHP